MGIIDNVKEFADKVANSELRFEKKHTGAIDFNLTIPGDKMVKIVDKDDSSIIENIMRKIDEV